MGGLSPIAIIFSRRGSFYTYSACLRPAIWLASYKIPLKAYSKRTAPRGIDGSGTYTKSDVINLCTSVLMRSRWHDRTWGRCREGPKCQRSVTMLGLPPIGSSRCKVGLRKQFAWTWDPSRTLYALLVLESSWSKASLGAIRYVANYGCTRRNLTPPYMLSA